jgi:hypothetical protein
MFGYNASWWAQKNKTKSKEYKPPEKCTFCSKKIEEGDYFNAGYDEHRIYAETCDHLYCKQWLKWKVRRKKK